MIIKRLSLLFAAIFTITLTACEQLIIETIESEQEMVEITVSATTDDDTRVALDGNTTTWEVGDKLNVALTDGSTTTNYIFSIESSADITDNGKVAKFKGAVHAGSYTKAVAIYPAEGATVLNRRSEDNIFMEAVSEEALVVSKTSTVTLPLEFSLLMHKVDYTLSLASGYSGTDISNGVAIEMLILSNDNEVKSVQCYNYDCANGGLAYAAASSVSTLAEFTSHNFSTNPTASTQVFPTEVENASLIFNIYVDGRKSHTITKTPSKSPFTMSAGRVTKVKLELSEENKSEVEMVEGGSSAGIEGVDTYLTSIICEGPSSWGNKFMVLGPNNISFALHIASNYSTSSSIEEGIYEMKGTSFFSERSRHIAIRSAYNIPGISATSLNGGNNGEGTMEVSKSGDTYTIKIVAAHDSSVAAPLGFIGKLNIENGGQTGGSSESVPVADITLTSLSCSGENGYYTFRGTSALGDTISFSINNVNASTNSINHGTYEHIAQPYCNLEGYFYASGIKVDGVVKSAKSGVLYATTEGIDVTLHSDITFSDGTTRHFVYEGAVTAPVVEGEITISASKSEIKANGVDSVTFTALQDGHDVTSDCFFYVNDTALGSASFTSKEVGSYFVYAAKGTKISNTVTINVVEYIPLTLTLTASKSSLVADGTDSATFTVKADSSLDVTSECEIYVNGIRNNGTTFKTSSEGTFSVYALYNGVKSNTMTITSKASERTIVFAEGVTLTSGWYDVNKKGAGDNGDINMCWAAASSNMIQWFQDRYKAAGKTLPAGAVDGPGVTSYTNYVPYELELMNVFLTQWDNSRGGHMEEAIPWYFEGKLYGGEYASAGSQATPKSSGGYWSSVWSSVEPYIYRGYSHDLFPTVYPNMYTYCYNNYYIWGNGSSLNGTDRLAKFTELVVQSFKRGIASLTISLSSNIDSLHHATTLWGYEIDNSTRLLTRVWLTDSDDLITEPKQQLLNEYSVSIGDGKSHIELTGNTRYGSVWVVSLHPLSAYGSAE